MYFVEVYQERLEKRVKRELDIKWDRELEKYLERKINKDFNLKNVRFINVTELRSLLSMSFQITSIWLLCDRFPATFLRWGY